MTSLAKIFQFRPTPTRWFETYVPRSQSVNALEALAGTGLVELEIDPNFSTPVIVDEVRGAIRQFNQLTIMYGSDFPASDTAPAHLSEDAPEQSGIRALAILRHYCAKIACLRRKERHLRKRFDNFSLLLECLKSMECSSDIFDRLSHQSDFLYKGVFARPNATPFNPELDETIYIKVAGENHDFFIVATLPEKKQEIDRIFFHCQKIDVPAWLIGDCHENLDLVRLHVEQLQQNLSDTEAARLALHNERQLAETIANLTILRWFVENAPDLARKQKLCHLSGWTTAGQIGELQDALKKAKVTATVRFSERPEGIYPPVMNLGSLWAAPFRIFVDLLGTPGNMEIDPTALLPVIVPLLFGFMFPDIGHGLILLLAGLLVFGAHPKLRILVPCGLYSIAFGFIFGDFFGNHEIIPALWFNPMDDPVRVLITCMVFGFCLILLSIVFSGIEAYWKGKLGNWLVLEAAVLAFYASGLVGVFIPDVLILTPIALGFYLLGIIVTYRGNHLTNILNGIGRLFESIFELMLNTLSFMRVGVFAIAHVGMSGAINQLAAGVEDGYLRILVLVIGHVVIIVVEALVVFIQTTRLVVFEFFIRFLRAEGRVFHPLNMPTRRL